MQRGVPETKCRKGSMHAGKMEPTIYKVPNPCICFEFVHDILFQFTLWEHCPENTIVQYKERGMRLLV